MMRLDGMIQSDDEFVLSDRVLAEYRGNGWSLIRNVSSRWAARKLVHRFSEAIAHSDWMLPGAARRKVSLPVSTPRCQGMEGASFQALHFDFGAPIHFVAGTAFYTCLATCIYFPASGTPGGAETRILKLSRLFDTLSPPAADRIASNLARYAEEHGDGWLLPYPFRTGRISCLARIIDAGSEQPCLGHFFDQGSWEWFGSGGEAQDGNDSAERERQWFGEWGVDLNALEDRVTLAPRDLLIIDNLRAAHGRLGVRRMKELFHFHIGFAATGELDCEAYRSFLSQRGR